MADARDTTVPAGENMRPAGLNSSPAGQSIGPAGQDSSPAGQNNSTIATFATQRQARAAIDALNRAGFDEQHVASLYAHNGPVEIFGAWGDLLDALTNWLLWRFTWVPGIGWVVAGGWLASTVISAGLEALREAIPQYEQALKADRCLVVVQDTPERARQAEAVLKASSAQKVDLYVGTAAPA
jgi:hypothetical protein